MSPRDLEIRRIIADRLGVDEGEIVPEEPVAMTDADVEAAIDELSELIEVPDEVMALIHTHEDAMEYLRDPKGFIARHA